MLVLLLVTSIFAEAAQDSGRQVRTPRVLPRKRTSSF
jgi:hypothetical protein